MSMVESTLEPTISSGWLTFERGFTMKSCSGNLGPEYLPEVPVADGRLRISVSTGITSEIESDVETELALGWSSTSTKLVSLCSMQSESVFTVEGEKGTF